MSTTKNSNPNTPFTIRTRAPGAGLIRVSPRPGAPSSHESPANQPHQSHTSTRPGQALSALEFAYPLKLVAPAPAHVHTRPVSSISAASTGEHGGEKARNIPLTVHTVFLLSYGGGLLPGDHIVIETHLERGTRLVLLTQGSTKIFKVDAWAQSQVESQSQSQSHPTNGGYQYATKAQDGQSKDLASQTIRARLAPNSALCVLPDPVQPFAASAFVQRQEYVFEEPRRFINRRRARLSSTQTATNGISASHSSQHEKDEEEDEPASLIALDWVVAGRPARAERWDMKRYESRNEVYSAEEPTSSNADTATSASAALQDDPALAAEQAAQSPSGRRLLLRDTVLLHAPQSSPPSTSVSTTASSAQPAPQQPAPRIPHASGPSIATRVDNAGAFGTLILCGPLLAGTASFFMDEFAALPRLGANTFDTATADSDGEDVSPHEARRGHKRWRSARHAREAADKILWTAARTRGFVVVKFSGASVEGCRLWIRDMLDWEGSVEGLFGERALLCLR